MSKETISVKKINETYLHVDCSRGVAYELIDYFSFYVEGYKFMPAYKNKTWDGKIRLFNSSCTLYIGLLKHLAKFCIDSGYHLEFESNSIFEKCDVNDALSYINDLTYCAGSNEITPRDYQIQAFRECIERGRRTILSSTNSGKSLMIYMLCHYLLNRKQIDNKILIVVPTTSLVRQMKGDFADYSQKDDWDTDSDIHEIMEGSKKDHPSARIYVSTWQSIYKMPRKYLSQFDCVIGDEVHEFQGKSTTSLMEKCINAKWRFGFTGTLRDTKMNQLVIQGLFGPAVRVMTNKESIERGESAKIDIRMSVLRYSDELKSQVYGSKYATEMEWLRKNTRRNLFITGAVLSRPISENSLILVNNIDQANELFGLIKKYNKMGHPVFLVTGSSDVDHRDYVRNVVNNSSGDDLGIIVIATFGVYQRGINIKNIHHLFFGSPSKSLVRVLQSIGRGLRVSDQKSHLILWDIVDDLSGKRKKKNFSWKHAHNRIEIYKKEGFPVTVNERSI